MTMTLSLLILSCDLRHLISPSTFAGQARNTDRRTVFANLAMIALGLVNLLLVNIPIHAQEASPQLQWEVGLAKQDITPTEPIRLSGYANRTQPFKGVDDPLTVRAMALRQPSQAWNVIVSVDCIGLPAELTDRILAIVQQQHPIERSRIVFCCTHAHTAPHLTGGLINLFNDELTPEEQAKTDRYSDMLVERVAQSIEQAIAQPVQASVDFATTQAGFAINRRKLKSGTWTGFGNEEEGPVDRNVRIVRVRNASGKVLGIAYQYACHCTSISPEVNRVSSDWAGISASQIEAAFAGCIALPIIGCGADANPNPRGTYAHAQQHGTELAKAVGEVLDTAFRPLPPLEHTAFSYLALGYERPTEDQLVAFEKSEQSQSKRFAASMRSVIARMGRMPETYPAPIHVWRFGSELSWVFMGGEVVVDYQIRLPGELPKTAQTWVAAYTDDVFAYVASERVRREGGYEVDGSMLYYGRPGRWESGTEEAIAKRVRELSEQVRDPATPLSAAEALQKLQVADGYRVEQVACEPLVSDPINIAFDLRGRAWVVEMGDYPEGGGLGGRIRILEDTDGDGIYDHAKTFLDRLEYPAGVFPWKDGAIIACAPEVFWARDRDGDDIPDGKEVLLSGFATGNPQHRVHGFTYGLDHRLHFGPGMEVRGVRSASGQTLNVIGADLCLDVDRGDAELVTGPSQFIRSQDDWGHWFGNDNMHPLFQYVVEHRYGLEKPRWSSVGYQQCYQPATAPVVYPLQRDSDRFNDLFTANRFTSACSEIVSRNAGLGQAMLGATLVCEPVHNLVSRARLEPLGASFRAIRFAEDENREWLRSDDAWFRPVRVENAPDGSVWVLDMYRRVIEHPEWIPEDWQARIDVRAGEGLGRIYRVCESSFQPQPIPNLEKLPVDAIIALLKSPHAAQRELAQRALIFRQEPSSRTTLRQVLATSDSALQRLHALAVLRGVGWLTPEDLQATLKDREPKVVRMALRWAEDFPTHAWKTSLAQVAASPQARESSDLVLQLLLTESRLHTGLDLHSLLVQHGEDPWILRAASLQDADQIDAYLRPGMGQGIVPRSSAERLYLALLPYASPTLKQELLGTLAETAGTRPAWHFVLATNMASPAQDAKVLRAYQAILQDARHVAMEDGESLERRLAALRMLVVKTSREETQDVARLQSIAVESREQALVTTALEGLRKTRDPAVAADLIRAWKQLGPQSRANLLQHLVAERNWMIPLIDGLESGSLVYSDLDPMAVESMKRVQDPSLQVRVAKILADSQRDPSALIVDYLAQMPKQGHPTQGKTLFDRHCALCHRDRGEQTAIGPNLATLKDWTDQAWLTSIMDPNRSVEARYRRTTVATDDGSLYIGILTGESEESLELVLSDGKRERILRSDIEVLRESNESLMPEGFGTFLTPTDSRHLLEYLRSTDF